MNTVTKEEYWSIILNDPTQIGQITTEDTEFNRRINDVNLVLSNTFINSSDENLISKWETSLYIDGIEGKTITERKADILYKLCEKNYVPVSIVKRFLLNLIGDENKFVVEFIKDENKLVIHTDRISDELLMEMSSLVEDVVPQFIEVEQYNHHIDISWRDINKYANCTTVAQIATVNSDYKNDLTSDGEWVYPIPKVQNGKELFINASNLKKCSPQIVEHLEQQYRLFSTSGLSGEVDYHFPVSIGTCSELLYKTKITKAYVSLPTATAIGHLVAESYSIIEVGGYFPKGTDGYNFANRCSNLKIVNADFPSLSRGDGMFSSCQLNKESALRVLNNIPAYTSGEHPLGIGIHVDHKTDEDVLAAIANAEDKGWTLTVRWNGTATSSASTMTMGSLIYAKVGEYELPDGTTERVLDWGHYVTDETGYETFRSLESAYKYFNLEQPTEF